MVGSRSSLLWKNFSRCGYLLFQHIHSACIPSASNGKQTTGDVVIKHVVILDAYSAEVKLFWCGDCAFDGTWVRQCSTFLTWNPALSLSKGIPPPDYFSTDSSPDFVVPNFFLQLTKYIRFGENSNSESSSGFIAEVLQCHLFPATLLIFPPLQNILLRSRSTSKHPQRLRNSVHTFYQNDCVKGIPDICCSTIGDRHSYLIQGLQWPWSSAHSAPCARHFRSLYSMSFPSVKTSKWWHVNRRSLPLWSG